MMGLSTRRIAAVASALLIALVGLFVVFRPGEQASAGVDLGDPHAWVEHGLGGELLQINATTGDVTARVEVAEPGEAFTAVQHGEGAVVLNTDANSVSLVSGQSLTITTKVELEAAEEAPVDSEAEIFGSPDEAGNVVVVTEDRLLSIDPQSEAQTPIALPEPLRSVQQDDAGDIVALSANDDYVLKLEPNGIDELAALSDPVRDATDQRSLVRAGSGTFIIDPNRLTAVQIEADGTFGLPFCTTSAVVGSVAGGSGPTEDALVLAHNPTSSTLSVSEPGSGCFDVDVDVDLRGEDYGAPVAVDGVAYLPNWSDGRIVVVDLAERDVVAVYPFGTRGTPFELEVVGNNVWANEPQGPFAAVVDAESITPVAKISTIVAGIAQVDEEGEGAALTGGAEGGGGLRIIGTEGEQVIASGSTDAPQSSDGNGRGGDTTDVFGTVDEVQFDEPTALGIEIDAEPNPEPVEPEPAPEPDEPEITEEIVETLIANFTVSSGTATEGEIIRFTDRSSGSPTSWTWDFGDGTGAQEPNVEKAWEDEGVVIVTLTVTNERGDQSTQSAEISIVPETVLLAPAADFTFDRNTIEEGESVAFTDRSTGEVDLLEWDFGDGESSVGPTATHTYDTAGTYTVTLTASNAAGGSSTSTTITVVTGVEPPQAAIAALPSKIVNGQFVTLMSASLNEPTRLAWDLGDGTRGSGESVQHAWATPGTYRVRLTAENSEGIDETFADVTVTKRIDPPVSQFTQSATEVRVGQEVTFTNLSLNEPTKLIWNFDDGTTANGQTTSKSWSSPGRYRVTLRATNEAGTNRTGITITVIKPVDPPVSSFNAGTTLVATDTRVNFEDTSTNNPTGWRWDFGDTGVSSNPRTSHEWAKPGTYTVRLTVSNEGGSSTSEKQIVVKNAPSANFRWEVVEGTTVKFTDTSWDDPEQWRWDFGDGNTSTDRSPTHTFGGGKFDVTLVVSNDVGSSRAKTQEVVTARPPVADISCRARGPRLICTGEDSARARGFTWSAPEAIANSTPNQETTTFTFPAAGRYEVTLVVSNAAGVTDTKTIKGPRVGAGQKPRVSAVAVASIDGDLVSLVATFDRGPTSWEWSVDGAELVRNGAGPEPVFRVPNNGRFTGTVKATNQFGTDTDQFAFVANGLVTEASMTWAVVRPGEVRFRNTSTAAPDAEYEWRFGGVPELLDENPAGPLARYRDAGGTFRVVLIVNDVNGRSVYREDIVVPPVPPPEDPPEDPPEGD